MYIKEIIKKAWAFMLMLSGCLFWILGEPITVNHYYIERAVVSTVLLLLGGYYYYVIDVRLAKYGRC